MENEKEKEIVADNVEKELPIDEGKSEVVDSTEEVTKDETSIGEVVEESVIENVPNVDTVVASVDVPVIEKTVEPVINDSVVNDVSLDNSGNSKPKSKMKTGLIIGLVVLLIAIVGGVFGYKMYVSNPLKLYKSVLNNGYEYFSGVLDEFDKNTIKYNFDESIVIDGKLKLNSDLEEISPYTGYDYGFKLGLDPKQEKVEVGLSMNKDGQVTLDGFMYLINNFIYMKSDKLYDKVLFTKSEEDIFAEINFDEIKADYNYKDIDKLLEKFTGYIENSLIEDNFKKEDGTVKLDGKSVKVTKVIYSINGNTAYEMITSITNDMKKDEEFIDLLVKISGLEKKEIKESLDSIEINKEDFSGEETVDFCIYTKGFFAKVIGFGVEVEDVTMSYVSDNDRSEFSVVNEESILTAVTEKGVTKGSLKVEGVEYLTFKYSSEQKDKTAKSSLEIAVNEDGEKINIIIDMESKNVNDKRAESKLGIDIKYVGATQSMNFGIDFEYNIEVGAKVGDVNTTGAVDMNTLSEVELQKILTNLEKAVEGTPLEILFLNEEDDDYYYDDDYDYNDYDSYTVE